MLFSLCTLLFYGLETREDEKPMVACQIRVLMGEDVSEIMRSAHVRGYENLVCLFLVLRSPLDIVRGMCAWCAEQQQ